ncbi:rhodanese-like domain-containing protein [Chromatiaceae bacterium AAb-1]|nr:rhodanese-like domain-containing protein [Chromatiaceae bacterium AAb-1]
MEQFIEFAGNHPILSLVWVALFLLLVSSWIKGRFSGVKQVSPSQLTLLVNRENATVVDTRTEDEFRKGHITGAKYLPAADIQKLQLDGLEKQKDEPIIVVCQAGVTAGKSAAVLIKQGFSRVFVLQGGMGSWTGANLPVVKAKR